MSGSGGNNKKRAANYGVRPAFAGDGSAPVRVNSTAKSSAGSKAGKTKKKKKSGHKGIAVFAVLAGIALVGFGLYKMGVFEKRYEITGDDGVAVQVTESELREMLTTDTFPEGIIINDIDVGGMTKTTALIALEQNAPEEPNPDIKLSLDGVEYSLDLSGQALTSNLEEVVDTAYSYLRLTGEEDAQALLDIYAQRQALKSNPVEYNSAYTMSTDGIAELVDNLLNEVASVAKDAVITGFDPQTATFEYEDSVKGYVVDSQTAAEDVKALLESGTYEGVVVVNAEISEPEFTSEMIEGEFGLIASSTSTTTSNSNRNHNISITCEKLNGLVLQDGETFSFNGYIGQRTEASGYKVAGVIENGQSAEDYGGGICQVSSMIYQSVIKSNLEVVERHVHMWPSSYAAAGTDAAVDWPNQDFQFTNNSGYPIAISAYWDSSTSKITVSIYGHELPDGEYIEFEGETVSVNPAGTVYIANASLPVGQTSRIRAAHDGVTATSYQIWYDADGNEIERVELPYSNYSTITAQIEVGVLNPDGSLATLDSSTGALTGVSEAAETSETSETAATEAGETAATEATAETAATEAAATEAPATEAAATEAAA